MTRKWVNSFLGLVLAAVLFMNQGCVALVVGAAAGAGGFAYIKGNLEQNLDNPVKEVYNASLKALDKLKIDVYKKTLETHLGVIYGYTQGQGKKRVKITIQSLTERASNIKVRVGIFGEESKSIEILEAVKKAL